MLKVIDKNILDITEKAILFHQTNSMGVMGSGLAKQIKTKYPHVFKDYKEYCTKYKPENLLGTSQICFVPKSNNLCVANIFGQLTYGRDKQYTDYSAVNTAMKQACSSVYSLGLPTYFPYLMGCGLGGGNWDTYKEIIQTYFPNGTICKLPEN